MDKGTKGMVVVFLSLFLAVMAFECCVYPAISQWLGVPGPETGGWGPSSIQFVAVILIMLIHLGSEMVVKVYEAVKCARAGMKLLPRQRVQTPVLIAVGWFLGSLIWFSFYGLTRGIIPIVVFVVAAIMCRKLENLALEEED